MATELSRRRFRLIAFGAEAIETKAPMSTLLAPLERLLRAGVVVHVVAAQEDRPRAVHLRNAVRGPHARNLAITAPDADDGTPVLEARGATASAGTAQALPTPLPRGVRNTDVAVIGMPRAARAIASGATVVPLDREDSLASLLACQAALHPVGLPGWIESGSEWHLVEEGFVALREHEFESLFAIGNGYLGSRASLAEGSPLSSPATFVAGIYDRPSGRAPDRNALERGANVPELLVLPDWARLAGTLDGHVVRIDEGEILAHRRVLDMRDGVLWREWRHRDRCGRVSVVRGLRLASLADRHVLLQCVVLTPENYSGRLTIESVLSGTRVARTSGGATVALAVTSLVETPTAFQRREARTGELPASEKHLESLELDVSFDQTVRLDRAVVVHTTRDHERPIESAREHLDRLLAERGVEGILADHRRAWRALWDEADVTIDGARDDQTSIRFAIYHLISSVHPDDEAVSVGARGLTGTSYKGHVFWDTEIYMLPFYVFTRPKAARSVLRYRYNTLEAARRRARSIGCEGALYAWESADTGDDVTPPYVMAPTGELLPVFAGTQEQHISADVAYAVWLYWHATHDDTFLLDSGAEILIETARFWASRAEEGDDGLLHIRNVLGPDEYHDSVDDNAYTNGMAAWNLEQAATTVELVSARFPEPFRALRDRLELRHDEPSAWRDAAARMYTGFDSETGLFEQFRGYFELEPIDVAAYEPRQLPMELLLGRERLRGSQVVKQPDVLMLLWLLWDRFPPSVHEANFRYYEPRTAHGSSLSPPIHAAIAARLRDTKLALRYFRETAEIDLANNMGNAAGGVHMAALGGLWQAAVLGFAGLRYDADEPVLDPHLPPAWSAMRFGVRWRGRRVSFETAREVPTEKEAAS